LIFDQQYVYAQNLDMMLLCHNFGGMKNMTSYC